MDGGIRRDVHAARRGPVRHGELYTEEGFNGRSQRSLLPGADG